MNGQVKSNICLALIHNKNIQRNKYIQPHLQILSDALTTKYKVTLLSISEQPNIISHKAYTAVIRYFMYLKLDRDWCRYRKIKTLNIFKTLFSAIKMIVKKYLIHQNLGAIQNRNSFIETIVTDKHIRAWSAFIETDCEYLICFEDDAVFQDNSTERLYTLFDTLINRGLNQFSYVDLAGGCHIDDLQISQLETFKKDGFIHYSKPVTNTACVYLLSRPLVSEFLNQLTRHPWLRLVGIDWMMNKLFIDIEKNNAEILCMHSEPPIFGHGSTIGAYKDWRK